MKDEVEKRMKLMGLSSHHNEDEPMNSNNNNEDDKKIPGFQRTDSMLAKAA